MRSKSPDFANRIIAAAARLFARQHFHEVRMDAIANEAEVSKGTLYSYFHDKDELYLALLSGASAGIITALEDAVERHTEARAKLVAMVDAIIEYFDSEPHLFDLIQRVEVLSGADVFYPWQQARDVAIRLANEVFDHGRRTGEFEIEDPELEVHMLFGGLRSVIRFGKRPRPRRLAERVVDSFLNGANRNCSD